MRNIILFCLFFAGSKSVAAQQFQINVLSGIGIGDGYWGAMSGRIGYAFQNGIYIGGQYTHHFGEEVPFLLLNSDDTILGRLNARYYGGEVGYDIRLGRFLLRPYTSIGYIADMNSVSQGDFTTTASYTRGYYMGGAIAEWNIFERFDL